MELDFIKNLTKPDQRCKIVMLVMDGLGGLPREAGGKTELETAHTPNLDKLAGEGICGLHEPIGPGIIPGSGPSHLALFGYDPIKYQVGRGVLSALGINFDLQPQDVAARGNFCTVDGNGIVTDRRAGRISTEKNKELCEKLREIELHEVEVFIEPVKEHRFLLVLRGEDLNGEIEDTDPQEIGKPPLAAQPTSDKGRKMAHLVDEFSAKAGEILRDDHPANMVVLRGFAKRPGWPTMEEAFGIRSAAVAGYPMYRGLAKLLGMDELETGNTVEDEIKTLGNSWYDYDFFYVHVKGTDSAGEDGDFDRKVSVIEDVDKNIPKLMDLNPDVVMVTGDHSTPSVMEFHSWHPVPTLLWSDCCRADTAESFGERACMAGGLGASFPAVDLLPIALGNAHKLEKFGA